MDSVYEMTKRWVWCALSFMMAVLLVGEARTSFGEASHSYAESPQGEPLAEPIVPEEEEELGDDDEASFWAWVRENGAPTTCRTPNICVYTNIDESHVGGVFRPPRRL